MLSLLSTSRADPHIVHMFLWKPCVGEMSSLSTVALLAVSLSQFSTVVLAVSLFHTEVNRVQPVHDSDNKTKAELSKKSSNNEVTTPCHFDTSWRLQLTLSGIATPGHTWACAHIKSTGAQGKNNVESWGANRSLITCAIASFMWTWSEHTGKTEELYLWPKTASEARVWSFMAGSCPRSHSKCVLRMHWVWPCYAHVTCSSFPLATPC